VTSYVLLRRLIVNNERGPLICTLAKNDVYIICFIFYLIRKAVIPTC